MSACDYNSMIDRNSLRFSIINCICLVAIFVVTLTSLFTRDNNARSYWCNQTLSDHVFSDVTTIVNDDICGTEYYLNGVSNHEKIVTVCMTKDYLPIVDLREYYFKIATMRGVRLTLEEFEHLYLFFNNIRNDMYVIFNQTVN